MIARIAPLHRFPRRIGVFDYRVAPSQRVQRGSLVSVLFRNRLVVGVVFGTSTSPAVKDKELLEVKNVLSREPFLPSVQLSCAEFVASQGFTSIATTLRSILPHVRLRDSLNLPPVQQKELDSATRAFLDERTLTSNATALISYVRDETKSALYRSLVDAVSRKGFSTLLITPTITRTAQYARMLPGTFTLHHALKESEFRQRFIDIRQNRAAVVIGTRSAVCAPVQNLGLIILDDEDADEHVQENPSPRFDARVVAAHLARTSGAKLVLTSRQPSLVSRQRYGVAGALDQPPAVRVQYRDLDAERRGGDYRILPEPTLSAIDRAVRIGTRVVIVHHRRVPFGSLECADCGYVPICAICNVPLRFNAQVLVCGHCATTSAVPFNCPRCKGVNLRGRSRGVPSVIRELRAYGIERVTDNVDQIPSTPGHIIVITPHLARELESTTYELAVVTRYDSLLAIPRADSDERARRLLRVLAGKLGERGTLIIQGSSWYRDLKDRVFDDAWIPQALTLRERFGYPPAWHLVVLRRRKQPRSPGISPEKLIGTLRDMHPDVVISGPLHGRGRSRTDPGGTLIVLRSTHELPANVRSMLRELDEGWTISIDPFEIR